MPVAPLGILAKAHFYLRFLRSTAMRRLKNVRTSRKSFVKDCFVQSKLLFKPIFKKRSRQTKTRKKEYKKIREGIANSYLLL